jgi:hypothetical protein
LDRKNDQVRANQAAVDAVGELERQLEAAGGIVILADEEWVKQARLQLVALQGGLESDKERVVSVELEGQFKDMELRRVQLQSAYVSAFGTPREGAAVAALKGHIRAMYENRIAAAKAGSRTAATRAAQLLKDLSKY